MVQMGRLLSGSNFRQQPLLNSKQVPKWLVDNPYIVGWCRSPSLTYSQCLLSVCQIHNQTLNIWTHIGGLFLLQYQLTYGFPTHLTDPIDNLFLKFAFIGIWMSYLCSVIYHVFNTSSFELARFLSQVDYFGITLHLIGVMLALVYFSFYHHLYFQLLYTGMYFILGAVCLVMNYFCMFNSCTNHMNSYQRSAFFCFIAMLSMPPQIYVGYLHSWTLFAMCFGSDMLYVIGAIIYSSKCPEKLSPGSFDLFSSHTIFHLFIIAAGYGSTVSLTLLSQAAISLKLEVEN
ncbi:Adiponectin receptor protein 2 [Blomia tropicalis]|nr:Adiponectin receptor protein 2 [Blomia tropicalis]